MAGSGLLHAQLINQGTETVVNTTTIYRQEHAAVAMDTAGNYVVVWATNHTTNSNDGIYAQRYLSDGTPNGPEIQVTTNKGLYPDVAMAPGGQFIIVWQQYSNANGWDVYGNFFNASGSPGGAFPLASDLSGNQRFPRVGMDSLRNFVAVWDDDLDIYAQRFNPSQTMVGSTIQIDTSTNGFQSYPDIHVFPDGTFNVVWESYGQDGSLSGIRLRRLDASGGFLSNEVPVNNYTTGNQVSPRISGDTTGNFIIVWVSDEQDGDEEGIYAQRFNKTGAKAGSEFLVNTTTTGAQDSPDVSMHNNSTFLVSWNSYGQDGEFFGVYFQYFDASGQRIFDETRANTTTAGFQQFSAIGMRTQYNIVIAWQDGGRQSTTSLDGDDYAIVLQNMTIGCTFTCPDPISAYLDASCSFVMPDYTGLVMTDPSCSDPVTITQDPAAGVTIYGDTLITFTVTDALAIPATCSAMLTLTDTISPVLVCPTNISVFLDVNCLSQVPDLTNSGTASDNCTMLMNLVWSQDVPVGTYFTTDTLVQVSIMDESGNSAGCSISILAIDTTSPIAVCQDITVFLDGSGNAGITSGDVDGGSTDNCSVGNLSVNPASFTCADIGSNNATLTVTDGSSNTDQCLSIVTVQDTTSPVALCQDITVFLDGSGNANITAGDVDGGSTDNCSISSQSASPTAFTCADIGSNNVTLTVNDGSSNSDQCVSMVTIQDTTRPVAVCQNITVFLDWSGNASITSGDVDGGSTDNCSLSMLSASPTSFTCANVGINNVVLTATDASGNSGMCSASLNVQDTTAPVAVCQNITIFLNGSGTSAVFPGDVDGGSSDNCAIGGRSSSPAIFNCTNLGPNNVTLTVSDVNGNSKSCTSIVTIQDTTSPTVVCQNITVYLDGSGNASITAGDVDGGSADNCGNPTLSASPTSFTCADIGSNNVTLTATDGSGNSDQCISIITVQDTTRPVAVCQNITVFLDGSGNASITAGDVDGGSTDNCSLSMLSASPTSFTCANTGSNNVVLTA
ncbi:MAG TPA: hypothetical protein P5275_20920, partial [Saprospiraceae bacterium]|nr:hypothetical protein [Saprospiraceae bacterium]